MCFLLLNSTIVVWKYFKQVLLLVYQLICYYTIIEDSINQAYMSGPNVPIWFGILHDNIIVIITKMNDMHQTITD